MEGYYESMEAEASLKDVINAENQAITRIFRHADSVLGRRGVQFTTD